MRSTGVLRHTCTPSCRRQRSSVRTICIASWLAGKTHWSSCVTSRTPSASNQRCVSAGLSTRRARRMSCSPRGYTSPRRIFPGACPDRAMSRKLLVRLHRPPPVTATLASSFGPASKSVTSASGRRRLRPMAQKHPAAPPPTMAIRRPIEVLFQGVDVKLQGLARLGTADGA